MLLLVSIFCISLLDSPNTCLLFFFCALIWCYVQKNILEQSTSHTPLWERETCHLVERFEYSEVQYTNFIYPQLCTFNAHKRGLFFHNVMLFVFWHWLVHTNTLHAENQFQFILLESCREIGVTNVRRIIDLFASKSKRLRRAALFGSPMGTGNLDFGASRRKFHTCGNKQTRPQSWSVNHTNMAPSLWQKALVCVV